MPRTPAGSIARADRLLQDAAAMAREAGALLRDAERGGADVRARRSMVLHYANGLDGSVDATMDHVEDELSTDVGRRGDQLGSGYPQGVVWRALEHLQREGRARQRGGWWRRRA